MARPRKNPITEFQNDLTEDLTPNVAEENSLITDNLEEGVADENEASVETSESELQEFIELPEEEENKSDGVEEVTSEIVRDPRYHTIDTAPKVGVKVFISVDGIDEGTLAYWKRTRRWEHNRWQMTGKWCDPLTNGDLDIEPLYWREV